MALWRVIDIITESEKWLSERGVPDPRLDAEYLLAEVLEKSRVELYMAFDRPLTEPELTRFRAMLKRRGRREPLQHILRYTEFMGLHIATSPAALIPRAETEVLVDTSLAFLKNIPSPRIIDVGTGTGCIAIALAKAISGAHVLALDADDAALELARQNVAAHALESAIILRQFDILKALPRLEERVDLVVSNPPYISAGERDGLQQEVAEYEPSVALFDGADGLTFYRRFAHILPRLLNPGGRFVFEFGGEHQEKALLNLFMDAGYIELEITRDYSGNPRLISGRYRS
ncbi:MAG: peptide chain release factor N(5)-glutamine methyltransferase [Lentisphaeria bacterium]|nr:peptide chain release factor N(5)-glutamine methyltransferase [Candidatus Neomarinimicrobiota bacterium]MCF7842425.1 peptide chain release factor N(5)-glutamine methyltransferase [Lentisphaeria bacterium]